MPDLGTAVGRALTAPTRGVRPGPIVLGVVIALLAAPIATHTWQATAVTGAVGLIVLGAVLTGRPRRAEVTRQDPAGWTVLPWVAVFLGIAALELGALAWGDRPQFPTLSWLLGPYFTEPLVRAGGWVVWLASGYWLVRR